MVCPIFVFLFFAVEHFRDILFLFFYYFQLFSICRRDGVYYESFSVKSQLSLGKNWPNHWNNSSINNLLIQLHRPFQYRKYLSKTARIVRSLRTGQNLQKQHDLQVCLYFCGPQLFSFTKRERANENNC